MAIAQASYEAEVASIQLHKVALEYKKKKLALRQLSELLASTTPALVVGGSIYLGHSKPPQSLSCEKAPDPSNTAKQQCTRTADPLNQKTQQSYQLSPTTSSMSCSSILYPIPTARPRRYHPDLDEPKPNHLTSGNLIKVNTLRKVIGNIIIVNTLRPGDLTAGAIRFIPVPPSSYNFKMSLAPHICPLGRSSERMFKLTDNRLRKYCHITLGKGIKEVFPRRARLCHLGLLVRSCM